MQRRDRRLLTVIFGLFIACLLALFVFGRGPGTLIWLTGGTPAWLPFAGSGVSWVPFVGTAASGSPTASVGPSPSPTTSRTPSPSPATSPEPTPSPTPDASPTPSPTPEPSPAPVPSPGPTTSPTPAPAPSPVPSPSPTPAPLAVTATANPSSGAPPLAVNFTSFVSGGTAPYGYAWTFGDGSSGSTAANPSHTYSAAGSYTARVSVTDAKGNATSFPLTIVVSVPPLTATATRSPASGYAPLTVNFTGAAGGGVPTYTYSWDFGDASPLSTTQNPSHNYTAVGSYTATLTVTDSAATTATSSVTVTVTLQPLTASATATPSSGLAPLDVTFAGSAAGGNPPYVAYAWDFGDGSGTSTSQNPTYTYEVPGSYTVTLTVTDSSTPTPATATKTITVTVNPPAPSVNGLSPNFGPESGGTTVTIFGNYFENASAVKFGSKSAAIVTGSLTCDGTGSCSIQATAPAQKAGTVNVTVTTPGGTSSGVAYTYVMAWQLASVTNPTGREGAAMVQYGTNVVLFGGDDGVTSLSDTWVWNGTGWTQQLVTGPTLRTHAAAAYYPDAGKVVVFGGCSTAVLGCITPLNDVWTWDGAAWTQITPTGTGPTARTGAAMAYKNAQLVVFGGYDGTTYLNDTYTLSFNSRNNKWTWTALTGVTGPGARAYAAAGTDASNQMVVFGGYNGTAVLGDTVIWNGTSWAPAPFGQNPAPSARKLASIGFFNKPNGGTASGLALFGGVDGSGTRQADTWTWNGTTWSLLPTTLAPSARYDAAASEDTNGGMLLFGGNTSTGISNETWRLS
jgi:PKD repeat protein